MLPSKTVKQQFHAVLEEESDAPPPPPPSSLLHSQAQVDDDGVDVILRLVAKHKHIKDVDIDNYTKRECDLVAAAATSTTTVFPTSLDALKAFVSSDGANDRIISLQGAGLSLEQWHAVTRKCSKKKVTIQINYAGINNDPMNQERFAIMETAIQNHCPAKIKLYHVEWAPTHNLQQLWSALESTTLLEELEISCCDSTKESFALNMDTISRNCSYRGLGLQFRPYSNLTPAEWELFCETIVCHPTLRKVDVVCSGYAAPYWATIEKDQILSNMICKNTVLCRFQMDDRFLRDRESFLKAVGPVLELNQVRHVVQAIKLQDDPIRRKQLFTATLWSESVRESPGNRYLLLKENFDMLEQATAMSKREMFRDWQKMKRHLDWLASLMRVRGMEIPSSLEEDEITWLARRRKRKRCRLPE